MNWSTGFAWWTAVTSADAAGAREADPADMGTAFGLDASFGPVDAEPSPPVAPGAPAPVPWEHRLTRRSSL
ncbi:MAG TPA: hypothetical protein VIP10_11560 [Burkholderiaceae bacterium]